MQVQRELEVSIPCWVFWASRLLKELEGFIGDTVSIPCWVFWASRPDLRTRVRVNGRFQSRAGFSGRLDYIGDSTQSEID